MGALVALALVIAAAAAFALAPGRGSADYPADSPEAAFQRYAEAWDSGDIDVAWDALTTDAQGRLSRWEFRDANNWRESESHRVWIDQRTGSEDRAVLRLSVETIYDEGIFGSGRDEQTSSVTMVREGGVWLIDTPLVGYYRW